MFALAVNSSRLSEIMCVLRSQTANLKEELAVCSLAYTCRIFGPSRLLTHHVDRYCVEWISDRVQLV